MKKIYNILLLMVAVASAAVFTSCEEKYKYEAADGKPTVHYIRPVALESADSLLTGAYLNNNICIVGDNLRSIVKMYFNEQEANLITSLITDHTLIVTVPNKIPKVVTDKIYMVNKSNDTITYDFKALVPVPDIISMSNEWARAGEKATIYGNYFAYDETVPLTVTISDVPVNIDEYTENEISFTVPAGLEEGRIAVSSVYGTGYAYFNYKDSRGMITDFEGGFVDTGGNGMQKGDSKSGIIPQGWNLSKIQYSEDNGVDGYYAQVGPSKMNENGDWNEDMKMSWWCGNWSGDPMSITEGPGAPLRNVFPAGYFKKPENLALKFELFIPSSNPWQAGALQVLFVNYKQCANDAWQNNTYILTKEMDEKKGLDLARGLYRPWSKDEAFHTGDQWITVTMPLSEFKYNMDGTEVKTSLTEDCFDSFIMWPITGGLKGKECTPILRYDNIRIIPIK